MSPDVKAKLAERGYWRVEVRPVDYVERRVPSIRVLQRAIERARVELRGWDFPHLERRWELPASQSYIGMDTDWSVHVEVWRAFLSGQFVYRGGVWTDWVDQHVFGGHGLDWRPKQGMPIVSSLWSITEFYEFAARYSQTEAGDDGMYVAVSFHGLEGRRLFGDHERRVWFDNYGPARLDTFEHARQLSRSELISEAPRLAVTCSAEFFSVFGYEAGPELLDSIQAELLQSRKAG
jgi:hypothetical protein